MLSMVGAFWLLVFMWAVIGAVRGWAREWLVASAVILAFLIIWIVETYTPWVGPAQGNSQAPASSQTPAGQYHPILEPLVPTDAKQPTPEESRTFWFRAIILGLLTFFGYQTPRVSMIGSRTSKVRGAITDSLLGGIIGAVNGYLIFGSLWYFLDEIHYPFYSIMVPPEVVPGLANVVAGYMHYMPPHFLLSVPALLIAVAVAFIFIIVVFI